MKRLSLSLSVISVFTVLALAQSTGSGTQTGQPAAPAPVGWVFTDVNGAMSVAYDNTRQFDPMGWVPNTQVNGSGHIEHINSNATTLASGYSWDRVDFSVNNLGFGNLTWKLNLSANMYVLSQGFAYWDGVSPYPPQTIISSESRGVLAVWGEFTASKGASRITDDFGWKTYAGTFGCVDMIWYLPNGSREVFSVGPKGENGANSGSRYYPPQYAVTTPKQTYNPNEARPSMSIANSQLPANQPGCSFSYYSCGWIRVENKRGDAFMEATYRNEPNLYGTNTWYGSITATEPAIPGGRPPRSWTWPLR